jgi:hypothetical protein
MYINIGFILRLAIIFGLPLGFVALDVFLIRFVRSCPLIIGVSIAMLVVVIWLWFIYMPRYIKELKRGN